MPIKLPRGFQRRKSSGNALDDAQKGEPSFRVISRPHSSGRSLDGIQMLSPPPAIQDTVARSSFDHDSEDLFSVVKQDTKNRAGTNNSLSTTHYDSTNSSTRLSSSSTNPSSVDNRSDRYVKALPQRPLDDIPAPPPPSARGNFLKNAGRTFSFGINAKGSSSRQSTDIPELPATRSRAPTASTARERSTTLSSVTTATAPQLDQDTFVADMDGFGDMFEGIGKKASRENLSQATRAIPIRNSRVPPLQPIESSPYSWNSESSKHGLMRSPSPSRTVTQNSPQLSSARAPQTSFSGITRSQTEQSLEDNMFEDTPLHKGLSPNLPSRPQFSPPSSTKSPPSSFPSTVMNSRARSQSQTGSVVHHPTSDDAIPQVPSIDPTLLASAELATRYQEKQTSPRIPQSNKIMTPAEFERYRRQKEDTRRYNKVFGKADSDQDSGDDYDDDEEDQREREATAAKQRKKQEAHLAVYRQQMMKVTGDSPAELPRPGSGMGGLYHGNSSNLDLSAPDRRASQVTLDHSKSSGNEEDEDEDVPLGILAAHGFPSKTRPPTKLMNSSSNPNLRHLSQIAGGAGSVAPPESNRGSLPAFARHLPADPYYGAGIVNPSIRESLAMHSSSNLAAPQQSGASTGHPVHPAGLVGVIAGEERARAARRGSPNTQGGYDMPPQPQMQRPGAPNHMAMPMMSGMPGMPMPMMSPAEQAQMQMSHNMNQMMQMQMQWMQQMAAMMGQGQMPGTAPTAGSPQMPFPPQNTSPVTRPQSVPLQNLQAPDRRTMSTLSPSMAPWNNSSPAIPQLNQIGGYAPSIAPSERSNVGLASRYRPVSIMTQEPQPGWQKRASTFTSTTFRPWASETPSKPLAASTVRTVQPSAQDDEDDEQGWAEMKARKDKKSRTWRLKKGGNNSNTLQELYNAPV